MVSATTGPTRIDWVDYAKGICIIFVVMMHSTLGVEKAAESIGWMSYLVAFAKPFRMPDFFLISGLFLARVIDREWGLYLDKKVLHFAYFYVLWVTIQFAFKAPAAYVDGASAIEIVQNYGLTFIQPFGTLWFIYLLPVFFVLTKVTRNVPWPLMLAAAAAMHIAPVHTGWITLDEFASRYVFFYSGYVFAPLFFRMAAWAANRIWIALAGLAGWAVLNGMLVSTGYSDIAPICLALGYLGAAAVILISALAARFSWADVVRYCGENSIVVYLSFFLPMVISRVVLLKTGIVTNIGTISLLVTIAGVIGSLVMFWIVQAGCRVTGMPDVFYRRPRWATLGGKT